MRPAVLLREGSALFERFMHWVGFGLCHQLPARSYTLGGVQAPVCVRDTGIYVGFLLGFVLIALLHRGTRPREFSPPAVWVLMVLLVAFMGWDGVSSYAGFRETTNELRLITGLGVGFSAAALITPMLNDELWARSSSDRVLAPTWRLLAWLAGIPASHALILAVGPLLGVAFIALIAFAIFFTLTAMNLVIVAMLPVFDRRGASLRDLALPMVLALGGAFAEVALAAQFRAFLLSLAGVVR